MLNQIVGNVVSSGWLTWIRIFFTQQDRIALNVGELRVRDRAVIRSLCKPDARSAEVVEHAGLKMHILSV